MKRNQRGVTMIGWIFLLTPVAIVLYAGLRIGPEYFNYYKVLQALQTTATALKDDETLTPNGIRVAIEKRFDTGYIDNPKVTEIKVHKGDAGWEMTADYETPVPLFGNLYALVVFNKTVVIN